MLKLENMPVEAEPKQRLRKSQDMRKKERSVEKSELSRIPSIFHAEVDMVVHLTSTNALRFPR